MATRKATRKQRAAKNSKKRPAPEVPAADKKLTYEGKREVKRRRKEVEEETRWEYYRTIPKRHYCKMSGRQPKTVNEQAVRYGLPADGAVVDLAPILRWLHDFLATKARKLAALEPEAGIFAGDNSEPALRYKLACAIRMEILIERELGNLLSRDEVHDVLARLAALMRGTGEWLQRKHGKQAREQFEKRIAGWRMEMERKFGPNGKGNG